MAKKPKMSGLNLCDDLIKTMKRLQKEIKSKDISLKKKKLLSKQIKILEKQWLEDCAPKGKKVERSNTF